MLLSTTMGGGVSFEGWEGGTRRRESGVEGGSGTGDRFSTPCQAENAKQEVFQICPGKIALFEKYLKRPCYGAWELFLTRLLGPSEYNGSCFGTTALAGAGKLKIGLLSSPCPSKLTDYHDSFITGTTPKRAGGKVDI